MKKTFKKLLSILMVFAMLFGMVPTQAFAFDYVDYSMEVALNGYSLGAKVADAYVSESSDSLAFCDFNDDNMFFSIFTEKDGEADWSSVVTEFEANKDYWLVVALTKQDGDSLLESELNPDNVTLEGGCVDKSAIYDDGLWWILFKLDRLADAAPDVYTIAFDANGGNVSPESATTGNDGKLASLPTPTHTSPSAAFAGWYTGKTGTIQVTTDTVFTSNTTIYAQWSTDYFIDVTLNGYEQGKAVADITFSENSDSVDIDTTNCHIFTEKDGAPDWSSEVTEFEANKVYWLVVALTKQGGEKLAESDLAASDVDLTNEYTEEQMDYDDDLWWVSYKLKPLEASVTEPEKYNVWVAGTQVTSANAADILSDGAASYNPTTNTLTVSDDITATGSNIAINTSYTTTFNIVIAGDVTLSSENSGGINSPGALNINIDETSKLTITAPNGDAVQSTGDISIAGGKLGITGKIGIYTSGAINLTVKEISIKTVNVAISGYNNSTINCDKLLVEASNSGAINIAPGKLTINGNENSEFTITAPNGDAIQGLAGVNINGGKLNITGKHGIYASNGVVNLTTDETIINSESTAIEAYAGLVINGGKVAITSTKGDGINTNSGDAVVTDAVLTVSAYEDGIFVCYSNDETKGNITFTDSTVTVTASKNHAIYAANNLTVNNTDIAASSVNYGLGAYGKTDIKNSSITVNGAGSSAIYSQGTLKISNNANDVISINIPENMYSYGIQGGSDIIINGGKVDITSYFEGVNSYSEGDVTIDVDELKITVKGRGYDGIQTAKGSINLKANKADVTAPYNAILKDGAGSVTIEGGTINLTGGIRDGICIGNENAKVEIKSGDISIKTLAHIEEARTVYEPQAIKLGSADNFVVADGLEVTAATVADGEFGDYVKANHNTYDHIKIAAVPELEPVVIEIPVSKKVVNGGNVAFSGEETFDFEVTVRNSNVEEFTVEGNSITVTDSEGGSTTIKITVPAELYDYLCEEGVMITEVAGEADGWTYSTESYLVKISPNGQRYMLEGEAEDTAVDSIVFTNTYTKNNEQPEDPATTSVTVVKEWDDNNNANRPTSVRVAIYANGEKLLENVLSERNEWTWTEERLQVAMQDGTPIVYTVDELEVPADYEKTVKETDVTAGIGFTITNTLIEEDDKENEEEGGDGGATTPTTPSAPSTPSVPDTSDNTNTLMYLTSLICAAAALVAVVIYRRKREQE